MNGWQLFYLFLFWGGIGVIVMGLFWFWDRRVTLIGIIMLGVAILGWDRVFPEGWKDEITDQRGK